MSDDIVAELDRWLDLPVYSDALPLVERARDEIVALRQRCALHDDLEFVSANELENARAEERERCARIAEIDSNPITILIAAAIRKEPS